MPDSFSFLMLSAMYENGGNTTHRFLDGHPELFVYPFESQIGTRHVADRLTALYPVKYRWPEFLLDATPTQDYFAIIDEECKIRARTPFVSKFRDTAFDFSDDERRTCYLAHIARTGRSRAHNVAAFFRATFEAWRDFRSSGREQVYVGYSPIIGVDAEAIVHDLPRGHVLHIVRNPWSSYADTKKRPVPMPLKDYLLAWCTVQDAALTAHALHPGRVHIMRFEDLVEDARGALEPVLTAIGVDAGALLATPTWNGEALKEVYPWGTIRIPTPEQNLATAAELNADERREVQVRAERYLDLFNYRNLPGRL